MLVLGHQSHGSTGATLGKLSGWRRGDRGTAAHTACEWAGVWAHVSAWADRLRGVFIECADALDAICRWDGADTLIYADPPYSAGTRSTGTGAYGRECTNEDHRRLADVLHSPRDGIGQRFPVSAL
jgi:DNA adenine methylase